MPSMYDKGTEWNRFRAALGACRWRGQPSLTLRAPKEEPPEKNVSRTMCPASTPARRWPMTSLFLRSSTFFVEVALAERQTHSKLGQIRWQCGAAGYCRESSAIRRERG